MYYSHSSMNGLGGQDRLGAMGISEIDAMAARGGSRQSPIDSMSQSGGGNEPGFFDNLFGRTEQVGGGVLTAAERAAGIVKTSGLDLNTLIHGQPKPPTIIIQGGGGGGQQRGGGQNTALLIVGGVVAVGLVVWLASRGKRSNPARRWVKSSKRLAMRFNPLNMKSGGAILLTGAAAAAAWWWLKKSKDPCYNIPANVGPQNAISVAQMRALCAQRGAALSAEQRSGVEVGINNTWNQLLASGAV